MQFAPTFVANAVALLFIVARLLGWDIPYAPAEVEGALTVLIVIVTQAFTLFRQWWTGRATLLGTRAVR